MLVRVDVDIKKQSEDGVASAFSRSSGVVAPKPMPMLPNEIGAWEYGWTNVDILRTVECTEFYQTISPVFFIKEPPPEQASTGARGGSPTRSASLGPLKPNEMQCPTSLGLPCYG